MLSQGCGEDAQCPAKHAVSSPGALGTFLLTRFKPLAESLVIWFSWTKLLRFTIVIVT